MKSLLAVVLMMAWATPQYAQVEGDPIQEVLSLMLFNNKGITSLALNVAAEEKDRYEGDKQYALKIKVMFLPNGKWYARYDQLDQENRPIETMIIKDDKCDTFVHQSKTGTRSQMTGNFVKADVEELSGFCFPILPLLADNKEYLDKHFSATIVQADKDYTWIRFVPKTAIKQRDIRVAQIGVINYENRLSSYHYPLHIAWIEAGGKQIAWRITRVIRNDSDAVRESDFNIELREYERNGWNIQRSEGFARWKAFIGLFTKEPEVPRWIPEKRIGHPGE